MMPFEWDVRISSKEHHGDRAHVQDDEPATGLHHLMGHYLSGLRKRRQCLRSGSA